MIKSISDVQYITLLEACKRIPSRPHVNTVKRWCDRGYNGIILKSWRHGNRRMTSIESIDIFFAKINGSEKADSLPTDSQTEAERALDAMGI